MYLSSRNRKIKQNTYRITLIKRPLLLHSPSNKRPPLFQNFQNKRPPITVIRNVNNEIYENVDVQR